MRILLYHQCIIYPEEERTRVPVCYGTGQYYHQSDITPDMQAVFDNTQYPDSIRNGYLNKLCQPLFGILVCKIIMDGRSEVIFKKSSNLYCMLELRRVLMVGTKVSKGFFV